MKHRQLAMILMLISLLFSVVGCSTPAQAPAATQAPAAANAELVYLVFETPVLTAEFWDNAIKASSAQLPPNVTVKKITSPGIDRTVYAKQLLASNQFPDLLQSINTQEFVDAKLLAEFDSKWIEDNFILPKGTALGGKVYSPPGVGQITPLVYYNKSIFDKVGVSVPKTYAELLDVAQKVKDAGYKPILECGAKDTWCTGLALSGIVSADVVVETPDWVLQRKAGTVKFADPNMVEAFTKFKTLVDKGYIDKGDLGLGYGDALGAFLDGKVAMFPMGSWFLQQAGKDATFPVGVFPWPRDDGKQIVPFVAAGGMHVSSQTKYLKDAMTFAQSYVLEPTVMKTLIENDAAFPLIKGHALDFYKATVTDLFKEGYAYVDKEGTTRVEAFMETLSDSAPIAGMLDEFNATAQSLIMGSDPAAEASRLDKLWEDTANRLKQ